MFLNFGKAIIIYALFYVNLSMTIEIKTPVTKEKVQQAIQQIAESSG